MTAKARVQTVRPSAPSGSRPYSTFAPESLPASTQPAPMPIPSATSGKLAATRTRPRTFDA